MDERRNSKQNSRDNRDRASGSWNSNVDPLSDFVSYVLSQGKLPRLVRIFAFLYEIFWRSRRLVQKE